MLKVEEFCISSEQTILDGLKLLEKNAQGVIFVVKDQRFYGTLSDGDIRRALIDGAKRDESIEPYCFKEACSLHVDTPDVDIQKLLSERIKVIPLLNDDGRVVDYASIFRLHRFAVMEPLLGGNELEYVTDCIKTNWVSSQGAYVNKFQDMLKAICQVDYCVATSNGTVSLHLALDALGIGPGDEVIVPDLTFGASVNSIIHAGAMPVLVDVDRDTWNVSPQAIENAITPRTKAIMPVHIYGNPCDMAEIMAIAEQHQLFVVEDCAEALGSTIDGQPVGSFGDAAAFSFFGNKVITCGEGGAVTFKDDAVHQRALLLRDHGMTKNKRYWHEAVGYNYRLTNVQAAIGCAQLEQLDAFRKRRIETFALYDSLLIPSGYFEKQFVRPGNDGSYWLYTLCLKDGLKVDRENLMDKLRLCGVDSRPVFYPMSQMPAFADVVKSADLSVCESISSRGISLPSSVSLSDKEIRWICQRILSLLEKTELMMEIS
jgi:perosamine synthetase